MPNAKDLESTATPRILLIGDSGTHKTFFTSTIPEIFIYDFDKGMAVARGRDVEYESFKDAPRRAQKTPNIYGIYQWGKAWDAFISHINTIGQKIDQGAWNRPIAFDSITTMSNMAMANVLKESGHTGPPQIQHWGAQMQLMEAVLEQLNSWPVTFVATAHIQRNQNDLTQVIEMLPLVTGKLAGKIGLYFDEVYYAQVSGKGDDKKFTLKTESDAMYKQAKTRYGVEDGTETHWQSVWEQIAPEDQQADESED